MLKIQEIRELIKLIDESSIDEFKYEVDGAKVKMKKNSQKEVVVTEAKREEPTYISQPVVEKQPVQAVNAVQEEQKEEKQEGKTEESNVSYDYEITSPMVGTFYRAPSPDSDPYVEVGDKVKPDTTVCIVEAMKLFNEIEAEVAGEIVEILVNNGELVEYGQPLFRVKK